MPSVTNVAVFGVAALLLFLAAASFVSLSRIDLLSKREVVKIHRVVVDSLSVDLSDLEHHAPSEAHQARSSSRDDGKGGVPPGRQKASEPKPRVSKIAELQKSLYGPAGKRARPRAPREEEAAPEDRIESCDRSTCGAWGTCVNGTRCDCLATHFGETCSRAKPVPSRVVTNKAFQTYGGPLVLSKDTVAAGQDLTLFLKNKVGKKDAKGKVSDGRVFLGNVDEDLYALLPETDALRSQAMYNSCAIVGSSGIVHHFENGRRIDAHDMVLRFNSAPTLDFEVGPSLSLSLSLSLQSRLIDRSID